MKAENQTLEDSKRAIFSRFAVAGFFFIVFVGSAMHFVYELSGGNAVVAVFAAVNESVWEHLKLAFFPAVLFSALEYVFVRKKTKNFLIAKTVSYYVMPITIIVLFYGYKLIFKQHTLVWDILVFVIAVALGQFANFRILISKEASNFLKVISALMLVVVSLCFLLFTYFPPHNFLFKDPLTGGFGIIR